MKYKIQRLDRRFSYQGVFSHCIKFGGHMALDQGPLCFAQVQKWFADSYGWSAEIRQYMDILAYANHMRSWANPATVPDTDVCNPHWSWTNGYDDLRIYVKSEQELDFFLLRWPCDR